MVKTGSENKEMSEKEERKCNLIFPLFPGGSIFVRSFPGAKTAKRKTVDLPKVTITVHGVVTRSHKVDGVTMIDDYRITGASVERDEEDLVTCCFCGSAKILVGSYYECPKCGAITVLNVAP